MTDFVINTAHHKRWWLPDRRHQLNSVIYGDRCRLSIIDPSGRSFEQYVVYLDITKPDFDKLHNEYQFLAEKRFPNRSLRKAPDIMSRWSR